MFVMDESIVRWGDAGRTSYVVRVKRPADPDYFESTIVRDDPNPEFAAMFAAIEAGDFDVGDYEPVELLPAAPLIVEYVANALPEPPAPVARIELWRVKRALRDIPATPAFLGYVTSSGVDVRGADGRIVAAGNLSGLDQINVAISLTDNVSLQDFWRDGVYVYANSPNFIAFAEILGLTPAEVQTMIALANSYVV